MNPACSDDYWISSLSQLAQSLLSSYPSFLIVASQLVSFPIFILCFYFLFLSSLNLFAAPFTPFFPFFAFTPSNPFVSSLLSLIVLSPVRVGFEPSKARGKKFFEQFSYRVMRRRGVGTIYSFLRKFRRRNFICLLNFKGGI